MAKLTLEEWRRSNREGETFTVAFPDGGELDLKLRSPSRERAEKVANLFGDVAAGVTFGNMRAAECEALVACSLDDLEDDDLIPILAAGGQELQSRLFYLCGITTLDDAGEAAEDEGKGSPSATP